MMTNGTNASARVLTILTLIIDSTFLSSLAQNVGHHPHGIGPCVPGKDGEPTYEHRLPIDKRSTPIVGEKVECVDGLAATYPCRNVNLLSYLPSSSLTGTGRSEESNDVWGWTSPNTNVEYAIVGMLGGTSFVDLSDPSTPVVVGYLPTATVNSSWRDIKVYQNHAFVVSEANGHGMQVFDMTTLEGATSFTELEATAYYNDKGLGQAHNVFINEDSGVAYVVGADTDDCSDGGLHMVDVSDPVNPTHVGCYADDGYTHDVQCVVYDGPDTDHAGKEICFGSNEDHVAILDVTNKDDVKKLSTLTYFRAGYTHQGWLTEDKKHFLVDDEVDEMHLQRFGCRWRTKTIILDVSDLCKPKPIGTHKSGSKAIDHNQYVKGNFVYQANYRAGLRVLALDDVAKGSLEEKAFFDVYPEDDGNQFNGAWSNYPFYESGIIVVSGIEQGLFVLEVDYDFPTADERESKASVVSAFLHALKSMSTDNY